MNLFFVFVYLYGNRYRCADSVWYGAANDDFLRAVLGRTSSTRRMDKYPARDWRIDLFIVAGHQRPATHQCVANVVCRTCVGNLFTHWQRRKESTRCYQLEFYRHTATENTYLFNLSPRCAYHAKRTRAGNAVRCAGVGYTIWYSALPHLTATRAATVQLSVPIIAAIGDVILLAEPVTMRLAIASSAVLGGVYLTIKKLLSHTLY